MPRVKRKNRTILKKANHNQKGQVKVETPKTWWEEMEKPFYRSLKENGLFVDYSKKIGPIKIKDIPCNRGITLFFGNLSILPTISNLSHDFVRKAHIFNCYLSRSFFLDIDREGFSKSFGYGYYKGYKLHVKGTEDDWMSICGTVTTLVGFIIMTTMLAYLTSINLTIFVLIALQGLITYAKIKLILKT